MGEIIARPKPPAAMPFTGERLTSDYRGQTQIEHLHRYLLAREWCRGRDVLDVASGEGYGTALLAQVAASAVGVELAADAVAHAAASYPAPNLRYVAGDARDLPQPDDAFDVVVSFETIEHFDQQDRFLREVRRVLRPGGLLIISTPDRDNYSPAETPANPFHVQEMTGGEFVTLLQAHFSDVAILLQRPLYGSVLLPSPVMGAVPATAMGAMPTCFERRGEDHFEGSVGLSRPQYLVAVASDHPVAVLPPSVYIDTGRLGLLSPPEAEARLQAMHGLLQARQAELDLARAELAAATAAAADDRAAAAAASADDQAQLEAYGDAARDRARELEALRSQLAAAEEAPRRLQACAAALSDREAQLDALRAELAGARGEVKGLTAANGMAEAACAAMREEASRAVRTAAAAEAAIAQARAEAAGRVAALEAEVSAADHRAAAADGRAAAATEAAQAAVAAAQDRAAAAEHHVARLLTSTSWRLSAPVRAAGRVVLGRS